MLLIYVGLFVTGFGTGGAYRTMPDRPDLTQVRSTAQDLLNKF